MLRFARPGERHTVELFWDEEWTFIAWYVNLQAPLVVRGDRFDTTDCALAVVVEPDGSWRWKDEDEPAEVVALGIITVTDAGAVRRQGERVLAERSWPTGWESWRPPAAWEPLPLPIGLARRRVEARDTSRRDMAGSLTPRHRGVRIAAGS